MRIGSYELRHLLGEGGMGAVWAARHLELDSEVAVKLVTGEHALDAGYRRRFQFEVQAMARLDHPGIARVFDYDTLDRAAASAIGLPPQTPYYVMEQASSSLIESPPTSWPQILDMLVHVLDALAHSHSRGVVHRDLKPGNILVFSDDEAGPRYKLADFGIAYRSREWPEDTQPGEASAATRSLGSPHYMAPEQWLSRWRDFGPWTDLYALGCVAYELVCGTRPFEAEHLVQLAIAHTGSDRPPLAPRMPVPPGLEEWIATMLARDHNQRFRRAADAAWALCKLAEVDQNTATRRGVGLRGTRDVDATLTVDIAELRHALSLDAAPSPRRHAPMVVGVPKQWTAPDRGRSQQRGLGLFGLHEPEVVDRQAERDVLWDALHEAATSGRPRAVLLTGIGGVGKSRLARWVCERADELGAAEPLRVAHSPHRGSATGIPRMLDARFVTRGLDTPEVAERVQSLLGALTPLSTYGPTLHADSQVIAEIIRPAEHGTPFTRAQRNSTLLRLLKALATRRALVLWVDDAQWDYDSLALCQWLLAHDRRLPLLIVATVRTDAEQGDSGIPSLLGRIGAMPNATAVDVAPLAVPDHEALLDDLVPLKPPIRAAVARHTQGRPLFAVQLVADWVEHGLLTPSGDRFDLRERPERWLPENLAETCDRRIASLVGRFPAEQRDASLRALRYAAALGEYVGESQWHAVCGHADLTIPDGLLHQLYDMGLAIPHDGGWSFAHAMFRDRVERGGEEHLRQVHTDCADYLDANLAGGRYGTPRQIAFHRIAADTPDLALKPLFDAADQHYQRAEYHEALELLELRAQLLDTCEVAPDDRRRFENTMAVTWYNLNRTRLSPDDAERIETVERVALDNGWAQLAARSAHMRGYIALLDGDLATARSAFARAVTQSIEAGEANIEGHATRLQGYICMLERDLDTADRHADRALEIFRQLDRPEGTAEAHRTRASIALARRDFDAASAEFAAALDVLSATGYRDQRALVLTDLGELMCWRGDYDRACEILREASWLLQACGMPCYLADGNRGLALLANGDVDRAGPALREAASQAATANHSTIAMIFELGLQACEIAAGRRSDLDEVAGHIAHYATDGQFDHYVQWVLCLLADICETAGLNELADDARAAADSG